MDFTNYINAELLALIPVLNLIGSWIKNSKIKDKYIPLVLGGISILLSAIYTVAVSGFSISAVITGVIQGVLVAATSVYANQIYKQATKVDDDIAEEDGEIGE